MKLLKLDSARTLRLMPCAHVLDIDSEEMVTSTVFLDP